MSHRNRYHAHEHLSPEEARFARVASRARRRRRTVTIEELEAYQRDLEQEVADVAELIRRRKAAAAAAVLADASTSTPGPDVPPAA